MILQKIGSHGEGTWIPQCYTNILLGGYESHENETAHVDKVGAQAQTSLLDLKFWNLWKLLFFICFVFTWRYPWTRHVRAASWLKTLQNRDEKRLDPMGPITSCRKG